MLENLFAALPAAAPLAHVALVTGLKHYLGPSRPMPSQARDAVPGKPAAAAYPNFYYDQEDVSSRAAARGLRWTVHRPTQ
jgi:hypothetical protein